MLVLAGAFLFYGFFIEPNRLEVNYVDLRTEFKHSRTDPITILQISDIHLNRFGDFQQRIIHMVNEIDPDLIFLTGDYIAWKHSPDPALQFFSKLNAKYGVYAVMGDYDYSNSKNSCLFCHESGTANPTKAHPVTMLRNSGDVINIDGSKIPVFGIDEAYSETDGIEIFNSLTDNENPALILCHNPLVFEELDSRKNALVFSGDTHGGQILLPKFIFGILNYEKNVKYNHGIYRKGNLIMNVSSGIGTSHFKFRLFNPPELTVVEF